MTLTLILFLFNVCAYANTAGTALPLEPKSWTVLSYNKIPSHSVRFSEGQLLVTVSASAGPIVYKLEPLKKVTGFEIKGKLTGTKKLETGSFDEDSILRIGLVATGSQTLTGPKRWLAAEWVKPLFSLAPQGQGLDKIYFYNITNRAPLVGKTREHPNSDLIVENVFANQSEPGAFTFKKSLDAPLETAAIWISIDGDDTKSNYTIAISEIKLF